MGELGPLVGADACAVAGEGEKGGIDAGAGLGASAKSAKSDSNQPVLDGYGS